MDAMQTLQFPLQLEASAILITGFNVPNSSPVMKMLPPLHQEQTKMALCEY